MVYISYGERNICKYDDDDHDRIMDASKLWKIAKVEL
jgi:hypothetical protein